MVKRWLSYLVAWSGCLIFYYAYREWISWIALVAVTFLPAFSLLVSLPAMLTARMQVRMPDAISVGSPMDLQIVVHSPLPVPRWRVRVLARHTLTQQKWVLTPGYECPTEHCGALEFQLRRGWIYDYLGLFRLPMKTAADFRMLIRPNPVKPARMPDLERLISLSWRPKPGGGYAENHELRLYRPGDNLHQIHWKLSAKTGELILREPMIPQGPQMLLWLVHTGDPELLGRKLSNLTWLSGYLLRRGLKHDILAFTGDGEQLWHISTPQELREAVDALLCLAPYDPEEMPQPTLPTRWQHCIGGDAYEES